MQSTILLIHAMSQNVALCCCALFAGAAAYISLVEQPTILSAGKEMTGAYIMLAQPRPAVFQVSFAIIGALAGITAGVTGSQTLWLSGGLLLGLAALFNVAFVRPETRRVLEIALQGEMHIAPGFLSKLAQLHAVQALLGLGALFMFIFRT